MADTYDIDMVEGSRNFIRLTAKNSDGTAIDLTNYDARGYVKKSYSNTGILIDLRPSVHTSYVSGFVDVNISGSMTSGIAAGQYVYDVEVHYSGENNLKLLRGYFNIHPEVSI